MKFTETPLLGAFLLDIEPHEDERGFFARCWCQNETQKHGINTNIAQCNISFNKHKGTIRGMHYQTEPYAEAKFVRCTQGAIFDVIIDLRENSPTYKKWHGVELTANNYKTLYIPKGFAHGYQTLINNSEVFYLMSDFYHPDAACSVPWNDPIIGIDWPIKLSVISEKDGKL